MVVNTVQRETAAALSERSLGGLCLEDESGRDEVYVRALSVSEVKTQVSREGGRLPTWSADGRELFFLQDSSLMAVTVTTTADAFESGRPSALFNLRRPPTDDGAIYDVAPDGKSFVIADRTPHDVCADGGPPHRRMVARDSAEGPGQVIGLRPPPWRSECLRHSTCQMAKPSRSSLKRFCGPPRRRGNSARYGGTAFACIG